MTQDRIEGAIAKTATEAKKLLFDKKGAAKGNQHFVAMLAMHTLCKPVSQFKPGPDDDHFRWRGGWFGYDPGMARIYVEGARAGDCVSDGVLCAAAIMLDATGEIAHRQLRIYAAPSGCACIQKAKKRQSSGGVCGACPFYQHPHRRRRGRQHTYDC